MAASVTISATTGKARTAGQFGPKTVIRGTIAFDNSYPTNGEALLLSQIGLSTIDQMQVFPYKGYVPQWDGTNKKVKMFYADYTANASGALIEVANTADLSAVDALPFEAIGDI